jgi:hypothetical protein
MISMVSMWCVEDVYGAEYCATEEELGSGHLYVSENQLLSWNVVLVFCLF